MSAKEVCFLISETGAVLWADLSGAAAALPDSRRRWQEIWRLRDQIAEIAHSHPHGPAAFSHEDDTTMAALDSALGRRLRYSVVAPRVTVARVDGAVIELDPEPWWAELLRGASGMPGGVKPSPSGPSIPEEQEEDDGDSQHHL